MRTKRKSSHAFAPSFTFNTFSVHTRSFNKKEFLTASRSVRAPMTARTSVYPDRFVSVYDLYSSERVDDLVGI